MSAPSKWKHRNIYAPRLRVLLDAVYIQAANLHASSTYAKYTQLVKELVSRGHFVYWMLPDVDYKPDPIEEHPQVGVIRTQYIQDQFVVDGLVTDEFFNLFNRAAGKYHLDVVVTGRTGAASMIKRVLESPRFHDQGHNYTDKHYGLPMVILEEFPQTPKEQFVGAAYWLNQCQGYHTSDATVLISGHNRASITQAMGGIYANSYINKWVERTTVIPSGIDIEMLDKLYDPNRWKNSKRFTVASVGRILGVGYREHLAWFEYLYKSGMDAQLIVSLAGGLGGPVRKSLTKLGIDFGPRSPQFKLIENNPRLSFLKMLRAAHGCISPMSHLDCPTGIAEALYLGLPLVLPTADYQKTFFPDYPFTTKPSDKAQLLAHLKTIASDPAAARKQIEPYRDYIRETFNGPINIGLVCDLVESSARKPLSKFKTSGAILGFLEELKGDRYTFADVVSYLRNSGHSGISIGDLGIRLTWTYGRGTIHHALRYAGFVDTCDSADEVFERKALFIKKHSKRGDTT